VSIILDGTLNLTLSLDSHKQWRRQQKKIRRSQVRRELAIRKQEEEKEGFSYFVIILKKYPCGDCHYVGKNYISGSKVFSQNCYNNIPTQSTTCSLVRFQIKKLFSN